MSDELPPRTRQELYERIARGGRDQVTLEEMIRLGFWAEERPLGPDGASTARLVELRKRLDGLRSQVAALGNLKQLAEEAKKQRMAESRKRRLETKQKKLGEREARKAAWQERKQREITYLGETVSAGLGPTPDRLASDAASLDKYGLPRIESAPALATALGLSISQLRFLAYHREVSTVSHYRRFKIQKRSGGERLISAPRKRLKAAQHWILHNVLEKLPVSEHAHGFCAGRSIITNAEPHVGASVVINVDLRDFFPSVSQRRIKGLFQKLGYAEEVATLFSLLCTEPDTTETELDGIKYYVARSERRLPQGAPSSPALTNVLCRRLDRRLAGFAKKHQLTYTRYADDLTLSAPAGASPKVGPMLAVLIKVAKDEGFTVHPDKVSIKRKGRRQEVTGIVVNERLSVDRRTLHRFRSVLYQVEKSGPEGKHWGPGGDVIESCVGFANYVVMVDPVKGEKLKTRALALRAKHPARPTPLSG